MKKHEIIYTELLRLKSDFIASTVNINKCINYNEGYLESKSYYEGQKEILNSVVRDISYLIQNIESGVLYENRRLQ